MAIEIQNVSGGNSSEGGQTFRGGVDARVKADERRVPLASIRRFGDKSEGRERACGCAARAILAKSQQEGKILPTFSPISLEPFSPTSAPLLILGGTTEGYALAAAAVAAGLRTISSLAGRTRSPRLPEGEHRVGGFGGVEGLSRYLRQHAVWAVVDATHPFAQQMGHNAAAACADCGVPLLRLERPAWTAVAGDRWLSVADWAEAVQALQALPEPRRVFVAVGRQELEPFAQDIAAHFVIRSVDRPDPLPAFASVEVVLARGPFSLENERELLQQHQISVIVCKNSGGSATASKLQAARELGIPVILKQRPVRPVTETVASSAAALAWIRQQQEARR